MRIFIVDAFTKRPFSGNPAGVVLLGAGQPFPSEPFMQGLASELRHSETVFVRPLLERHFHLRYFTAVEEVPLCGHATIAAFTALRHAWMLSLGGCQAQTAAGQLDLDVEGDTVWMDMARPRKLHQFEKPHTTELLEACGLSKSDADPHLPAVIVDAGLPDILLAVKNSEALEDARMDSTRMTALSQRYGVVGFHLFTCDSAGHTARCRNFAPILGIEEESATGTANAALTYHLHLEGRIPLEKESVFLQGESMGKPSEVRSRIHGSAGALKIRIGGAGAMVLESTLLFQQSRIR